MVLEDGIPKDFADQLLSALTQFGLIFLLLTLVAFAVGFLVLAIRYGPLPAGDKIYRVLLQMLSDLGGSRLRRIFALARLAVLESIRKRVMIVFVLFSLIMIFAGWFLDTGGYDPGRGYLFFVLWTTKILIWLLAALISALSLPADLKSRTIYTIVTKPVRASEIVLGRILGFGMVGTALLIAMGLLSYLFVVRGVDHTHTIDPEALRDVKGISGKVVAKKGLTSKDHGHEHDVTIDLDKATGYTNVREGHWHEVIANDPKDLSKGYTLSKPLDLLNARVPIYGKLQYLDRQGHEGRGISVGNEWEYRRFIEGNTLAAAIWTFKGVTKANFPPEKFKDGLPIDLSRIDVFRTRKGDIESTVRGSLALRNPKTKVTSHAESFNSKKAYIDHHVIPWKLEREVIKTQAGATKDKSAGPLDLWEDLVDDEGQLEVILKCEENAQFFGVAQPDMYLLADEGSYRVNFFKGYLGLWMQMMLIIGVGVMWSTLLTAPVALLATASTVLLGQQTQFINDALNSILYPTHDKAVWGGGPIESLIRGFTQDNVTSDFKVTGATAIQFMDKILMWLVWLVSKIIPDFKKFDNSHYLIEGFNIPASVWGSQLVDLAGYMILMFLIGYMFLRNREVAA